MVRINAALRSCLSTIFYEGWYHVDLRLNPHVLTMIYTLHHRRCMHTSSPRNLSSSWVWMTKNVKWPKFYQTTVVSTFTYARSGYGAETGGFWHFRSATTGMSTHTRSRRGRICHLLRTKMVLREGAVSKPTRKIRYWTHLLRSGFCPRSASTPRPRMCERM